MSSRAKRVAAVAFSCLLWSGSLVASKLSYDTLGPMSLGFMRFALSTLVFFALRPILKDRQMPDALGMAQIAFTGFLGTTLYFAAENYGVALIPASTSSLIVGSFPAMALALE